MLRLFRSLRRKALSKYFLYALGEVFLVVIGILFALQINAWNQKAQDLKKEQRYLHDLMLDLKQDSIKLSDIHQATLRSALAKQKLLAILREQQPVNDSLPYYFQQQYYVILAGAFRGAFRLAHKTIHRLTGGIQNVMSSDEQLSDYIAKSLLK